MKVTINKIQKHAENHIVYLNIEDDGEVIAQKSLIFGNDEKIFSARLREKLDKELEDAINAKKELASVTEKVQNVVNKYNKTLQAKE